MTPLSDLYKFVDDTVAHALAEVLAREGTTPPCRKGCFHCCREPAYCSRRAVDYMLESLSPDQRAAVETRTRVWLTQFQQGGFESQKQPSAFTYRGKYLWCPLLENGACLAYERRPEACRTFIAKSDPDACRDDIKRVSQKFMGIPGLIDVFMRREINGLGDGEELCMDHIGILLAEALFGYDQPSAARIRIRREGDELKVITYDTEPEAA